MDAYPEDYIVHNLPLFVVSGLEDKIEISDGKYSTDALLQDGGFRIRIDAPCIQGAIARPLLEALLEHDATNAPWSAKYAAQAENQYACRVKSVGRSYTLPPRKASPPPYSPQNLANLSNSPMTLHSTLSPLSPSSPLYADGIMSPLWMAKHLSFLPSVFIVFLPLMSDTTVSTLEDNRLKSEITNVRSTFASVTYKTRLIVILVGDAAIDSFEAEDRTNNIRRATGIDSRSLSYLAGSTPSDALFEYAAALISNVHQTSLEYYRDLSKHARRKRNRSTVPQPTIQPSLPTMPILNLQGWNVRYEFKLGVFAEFRQEMEAALRNYETAYDILVGPEVFGVTPSWSVRFDQNRLLADVIAIRIIRASLWMGQTTNAARSWLAHRDSMAEIVNRYGVGTGNYGWESWKAIWSRTMSELIQRSQIFPVPGDNRAGGNTKSILIHSEKTLATTDRFTPWESLHHQGYWLNIAQRYTQNRREYAQTIPETDRKHPNQSRASSIAKKAYSYDRYMALEPYQENPIDGEPGPNYTKDILHDLDRAIEQFSLRDQAHMASMLRFRKAEELIRASLWTDAIALLVPLWRDASMRRNGWWLLASNVGRALQQCAMQTGDKDAVISLCWEASNPTLNAITPIQFVQEAASLNTSKDFSRLTMASDSVACQIIPQFAFAVHEGYVGKSIQAQLIIRNFGQLSDAQTRLSLVKITFEGGIRPLYLLHDEQQNLPPQEGHAQIVDVAGIDASTRSTRRNRQSSTNIEAFEAITDLTLMPDSVKIFQIEITPREAGEASVASITLQIENEGYEIAATTVRQDVPSGEWWESKRGKPVSRRHGKMRNVASILVLPKPPRIEARIQFTHAMHYTNDNIELAVHVTNEEDEVINGHIQVRLVSASKNGISLEWVNKDGETSSKQSEEDELVQLLPWIEMDNMAVGQSQSYPILITRTDEAVNHALEIVTTYTLASAIDTPLTKLATVDLPIIRPFEANFNFHPRRHPDLWPQFFSMSSIPQQKSDATGIKQQYRVTAVVQSFATDAIQIESSALVVKKLMGHVICSATSKVVQRSADQASAKQDTAAFILGSRETVKINFESELQKLVLGDGEPAAIDFELEIKWRRVNSDGVNRTTLQAPRFLAHGSEPRVLLQLVKDASRPGILTLDYTIENATMHFLTFNMAMESSDDFAFSGPKSKSVSLVPISRYDLQYHIMPIGVTEWTRVSLVVVDAYFGQTLKIEPASDGVKVDKQGHVLVNLGH